MVGLAALDPPYGFSPSAVAMQAPLFPTSRLEIAGIHVQELAGKFGTPTFVYDAAKIVERFGDLAAFDYVR